MSDPESQDDDRRGDDPREEEAPGVGDAPMRASILSVLLTGLCFGVVGFAVGGARTGLGVTLGGLIATANLWVFARVGQAFMHKRGSSAPWGVVAILKMTFLFGGVWLILRTGVIAALPLILGYAALPVGIVIGSVFGPKPPDTDEPQTPSARRRGDVIKGARAGRKDPR
jgi:hypothetical protein